MSSYEPMWHCKNRKGWRSGPANLQVTLAPQGAEVPSGSPGSGSAFRVAVLPDSRVLQFETSGVWMHLELGSDKAEKEDGIQNARFWFHAGVAWKLAILEATHKTRTEAVIQASGKSSARTSVVSCRKFASFQGLCIALLVDRW